jgi:hypothetical protein
VPEPGAEPDRPAPLRRGGFCPRLSVRSRRSAHDFAHDRNLPVARAEPDPLRRIEAELTDTKDRTALLQNRRFRKLVFDTLDDLLGANGEPGLLSLDVFDTLLLRDGSSEVRRFMEIGARMAARAGPGTTAVDALVARHLATRASYRAGPGSMAAAKGRLREIHETAARSLGLPRSRADDFIEAEIHCETGHVEPNTLLVSYMRKHQARGGRTC